MTFSVFVPCHGEGALFPVLWYLSGLTCTHANVIEKEEYRAACAKHGIVFVAPDTSLRGEGVRDAEEEYDFGQGAGFYVDATQDPWAGSFRMRTYIEDELPDLLGKEFPVDMARQSITGHSMGGHGALTIGLRNPGRFRSVSASARRRDCTEELTLLKDLCETMKFGSLCALGGFTQYPVLSALKHWPDDFAL